MRALGAPYEVFLLVAALALAFFALSPAVERWRGWALAIAAFLLLAGEGALVWFHLRLYELATVVSPDGVARGSVAVPLWVESEKLFVWALLVAVFGTLMRAAA